MARKPTARKSAAEQPVVLPRSLAAGIQSVTQSTGKGKNIPLTNPNLVTLNKSIADVRTQATVYDALRLLKRLSGDTGTAIASFARLASTPLNFHVYDSAHQLSEEGELLVKSILANFENLADYSYGFDDRQSLRSLVDTLLTETLLAGSVGLELVLDKARLPFKLQPVSTSKIKWNVTATSTGKSSNKIAPLQQAAGEDVSLDIATFFVATLDSNPNNAYSESPLEAALNAAIYQSETHEDIRRAVKRSGHSRLVMKLITEQIVKAAPPEVKMDPQKMAEYMEGIRSDLVTAVESLDPEAALVLFDSVEADYLTSEIGASADYGPFTQIVDGLTSTALRTPPSVLGKRMAGSQNVSSMEALIFIKHAAGLQQPVVDVLSKALTLAVRLYGFEGYVQVAFEPIDLRPETELEAFRAMKQARVLELLSLGFLSDQEAAEMLATGMRAPGAPPLSGTFFYGNGGQIDPTGMDTQSSVTGDPGKRGLTGNAPKKAGGRSQ